MLFLICLIIFIPKNQEYVTKAQVYIQIFQVVATCWQRRVGSRLPWWRWRQVGEGYPGGSGGRLGGGCSGSRGRLGGGCSGSNGGRLGGGCSGGEGLWSCFVITTDVGHCCIKILLQEPMLSLSSIQSALSCLHSVSWYNKCQSAKQDEPLFFQKSEVRLSKYWHLMRGGNVWKVSSGNEQTYSLVFLQKETINVSLEKMVTNLKLSSWLTPVRSCSIIPTVAITPIPQL